MGGFLAHRGVRWITLGWTGFLAENVILSNNREYLIKEAGESTYHGAYNFLSTLATGSILYGYIGHGRGQGPKMPFVLGASPAGRVAATTLQALGFIGFSQSFPRLQMPFTYLNPPHSTSDPLPQSSTHPPPSDRMTPAASREKEKDVTAKVPAELEAARSFGVSFEARCPFDFHADKHLAPDSIYNLNRVTRHPMLWSLAFSAAGTALRAHYVTEVVMFGFPTAFALIGGAHQDYRYRRGSGGMLSAEKEKVTSHVPFVALLTGRQSWSALFAEVKGLNAGAAVGLALLLARRKR